jgi:hypothetical protein
MLKRSVNMMVTLAITIGSQHMRWLGLHLHVARTPPFLKRNDFMLE